MQKIKEIRTATITKKGQICIPNTARTMNGFKEGSKVTIVVFEDKVELRPFKKMSDAVQAMLASENVLAENWLSKEDEKAWKNL